MSNTEALKPCPFCGAGLTSIRENGKMWTGQQYSEPTSVSVQHHCEPVPGQPSRMIERIGRDEGSAIDAWNRRAALAQPAASGEPSCPHKRNGFCGKDGPCLAPYCRPTAPTSQPAPVAPQEPVAWRVQLEGLWFHGRERDGLRAALAVSFGREIPADQAEPLYAAPQPVAQLVAIELERLAQDPPISGNALAQARVLMTAANVREFGLSGGAAPQPAPRVAQPLTDARDRPDQGSSYVDGYGYVDTAALRAIEAAHGITAHPKDQP